jgi:hypothetical protein
LKEALSERSEEKPSSIARLLCGLVLVLAGISFRIVAAQGELWLDEIWSLRLTQQARSVIDIFLSLPIDNNHVLNSVWLYMLGTEQSAIIYRLVSLFASTYLLSLVLLRTRTLNFIQALSLLLLFSFSFPMIILGAEARGYAMAIPLLLSALYLIEDAIHQEPKRSRIVALWVVVILGTLAHASFIPAYFCLFIWSAIELCALRRFTDLAKLHAIPAACLSAWSFIFVSNINPPTGILRSHLEIFIETLSVSLGGPFLTPCQPTHNLLAVGLAGFILLLAIIEIIQEFRENNSYWLLLCLGTFGLPLLSIGFQTPRVIFLRYFTLNLVFLFFLLSSFQLRLWRASKTGKLLSLILLASFLFGSSRHLYHFWHYGRGDAQQVLSFLEINSDCAAPLSLSTDHQYRIGTILDYLQTDNCKLEYINNSNDPDQLPQWFIAHSVSPGCPPESEIPAQYVLRTVFPFAGLSGWSWYIYQHQPPSPLPLLLPSAHPQPDNISK